MNLLVAAPPYFPFAPHAAVFFWLLGVVLTIPALIVAGVACRKYTTRPVFALKSFRIAAILAIFDVAALVTVLLSVMSNPVGWRDAKTHQVDYGFVMFQFAATSILWGVLLLIRKKLTARAAQPSA